jgi:GNAT superfamily N-acetyltransferase
MEAVHGPLGFTDLDPEGMLIEGFDELGTLALIYNYEYYPEHLKKLGYEKEIDWLEYEIHVPERPIEKISKAAEIVLKRNKLHILEVSQKKDLLKYSKELFYLLDDEYSHLFGTVPLSEKQMETYIKQYFGFISPEFVPVVLDENNKMVAFGIVMPSLSIALQKSKGRLLPFGWYYLLRALKKNDRADLYLIAVKSEYQGKGINAVLMDKINQVFIKKGITIVETNAELETNTDVRGQWKYYEKRQHKRRRCYIKTL